MIKTFHDSFPELNLAQLENYAKEWAVNFSIEFDRIVLFRYLNPRKALHEHAMRGSIPGRYLILFELKESVSDDISEQCKRLLLATGQYSTIQDPNINTDLKMLRDDNFHRVYKNKSDYVPHDWKFRVKDPYTELPHGIKEEAGYFWVLYDSTKKDFSTVDIQMEAVEQNQRVFPCDPGTKWQDIKITLISSDAVMIKTPNGSGRFHFSELSMKDGRKGDIPTMLWELLVYFCRYSGRITSTTSIDRIFNLRFRNLSKSISDLNKKLQNVFGIDENFCHKYKKKDGWVAKCIFNDDTF